MPRSVLSLLSALLLGITVQDVSAQTSAPPSNPRFGRWLLKSEAAAPASNIMTYEPFGAAGMTTPVMMICY